MAAIPMLAGSPTTGCRQVLVRDLVTLCSIGVHLHEEQRKQRIRVNLQLDVLEEPLVVDDRLENVVDYHDIISGVRRIIDAGHVRLIETLAQRIAEFCLADSRVRRAWVMVEKLDVYQDIGSVAVALERFAAPA